VYLAIRDLRRSWRRFVLVGSVVLLVGVLSTVLAGLANGLTQAGTSGLRTLSYTQMAFQPGSQAIFSRSTLNESSLSAWQSIPGARVSPLGVSFVNATSKSGPSIDLALFGMPADSFLVQRPEWRSALAGPPGLVVAAEVAKLGVKVGDIYTFTGSGVGLPVLGFTSTGSYGHVPIAYTSLATWQTINYGSDARGRYSAVALKLPAGAKTGAAIRASHTELMSKPATFAGSPGFTAETMTMNLIRGFLLVICALIIGAFFAVLTIQRTRQIGLLKAMGASSGYVIRDGIAQLIVVVVVATSVGAVIGLGLLQFMKSGGAPIAISLSSTAASAALLIATGLVGSLVAFRRITTIEPAIALGMEA
jgi:putative ABC transport system permease protein